MSLPQQAWISMLAGSLIRYLVVSRFFAKRSNHQNRTCTWLWRAYSIHHVGPSNYLWISTLPKRCVFFLTLHWPKRISELHGFLYWLKHSEDCSLYSYTYQISLRRHRIPQSQIVNLRSSLSYFSVIFFYGDQVKLLFCPIRALKSSQ